MNWSYQQIRLELLFTFKISRNASDFKTNFILTYFHEGLTAKGECAPNVRYGESVEEVNLQFQDFVHTNHAFNDMTELYDFLSRANLFQSVKNAIETCFTDYYAQKTQRSTTQILGLDAPTPKATMFTIPIMEAQYLKAFYEKFKLEDYQQIKLKVNKETAVITLQTLAGLVGDRQLFIDANESFSTLEEYMDFEAAVSHINITFVEQPFPAHQVHDYLNLKPISRWPVFGDESIINLKDMELVSQQFHGVNVKMMKAGGYAASVAILQKAKSLGLKTMVGCMVETSLGISQAFQISSLADYLDLDSFLYLKEEPYRLIHSENGTLSIKGHLNK